MLTVSPGGGFANGVSFSCAPVTGVTCNFNPSTVTPASGAASTTLTVTTSATVSRYGLLMPDQIGPWTLLVAIVLFGLGMWRARKFPSVRVSPLAASVAIIIAIGLAVGGCGGYASTSQANRGTATIMVTAQAGTVSHTTTVSVTVQ